MNLIQFISRVFASLASVPAAFTIWASILALLITIVGIYVAIAGSKDALPFGVPLATRVAATREALLGAPPSTPIYTIEDLKMDWSQAEDYFQVEDVEIDRRKVRGEFLVVKFVAVSETSGPIPMFRARMFCDSNGVEVSSALIRALSALQFKTEEWTPGLRFNGTFFLPPEQQLANVELILITRSGTEDDRGIEEETKTATSCE